jgi:hypothetical protein
VRENERREEERKEIFVLGAYEGGGGGRGVGGALVPWFVFPRY